MSYATGLVQSSPPRRLRPEEQELIQSLLSTVRMEMPASIEGPVVDMLDGGMGGIRFVRGDSLRFGQELASAEYRDGDGGLVSITLNADDRGDRCELVFWKTDFSPLKKYPNIEDFLR